MYTVSHDGPDSILEDDEIGDDLNDKGLEVNIEWTMYSSPEGFPYYYNAKTGESRWADDFEMGRSTSQNVQNEAVDWTTTEINRYDSDISMYSPNNSREDATGGDNYEEDKNWNSILTKSGSVRDNYFKNSTIVSNYSSDSIDSYRPVVYTEHFSDTESNKHSISSQNKAYHPEGTMRGKAKSTFASKNLKAYPHTTAINNHSINGDISDDSQISSPSEYSRNAGRASKSADNNYYISDDSQIDSSSEGSAVRNRYSDDSSSGSSSENENDSDGGMSESRESSEEDSVLSHRKARVNQLASRITRERILRYQRFRREKELGIPVFNPNEEASFQEFLFTEEGLEAIQYENVELSSILRRSSAKKEKTRLASVEKQRISNLKKGEKNVTSIIAGLALPAQMMIKSFLTGTTLEDNTHRRKGGIKVRDLEGGKKSEKKYQKSESEFHTKYPEESYMNNEDKIFSSLRTDMDKGYEGSDGLYEGSDGLYEGSDGLYEGSEDASGYDTSSSYSSHNDSISSTDSDMKIVNTPLIPNWETMSSYLTETIKQSYLLSSKATSHPPEGVTSASPRDVLEAPETLSDKNTSTYKQKTGGKSYMQEILALFLEVICFFLHFLFLGSKLFLRESKLNILKVISVMQKKINTSTSRKLNKEREVERLSFTHKALN